MATKSNQYIPQIQFHPGETLAEKVEELGMGPKEFSVRTNKPEKTIICDQESKMQQKWESECSIIGNSNTSKLGTIMQR